MVREAAVACPFFMPMEKLDNGTWVHAGRLPLGCGWSGQCMAPGYMGEVPSEEQLHDCNLGYAEKCARLPRERKLDSVRFGARTVFDERRGTGSYIQVRYIGERDHCPVEHGVLEFDSALARWNRPHGDEQIHRMAECFLASYMEKRKNHQVRQVAS
jgi:hypothetical protein